MLSLITASEPTNGSIAIKKRAPATSNGAQFKTKRPGGLTALSSILKDNLRPSDSRQ